MMNVLIAREVLFGYAWRCGTVRLGTSINHHTCLPPAHTPPAFCRFAATRVRAFRYRYRVLVRKRDGLARSKGRVPHPYAYNVTPYSSAHGSRGQCVLRWKRIRYNIPKDPLTATQERSHDSVTRCQPARRCPQISWAPRCTLQRVG